MTNHSPSLEKILSVANELKLIAQQVGLGQVEQTISGSIIPKLKDHRFHVVVAGEFSNGKTSLINALIRDAECLPTSSAVNSFRVVEIVGGSPQKLIIVHDDDRKIPASMAELPQLVQNTDGQSYHLELTVPCPLCEDGVVIVDTPGIQDISRRRIDITFKYLPKADMLIYVADATSGIKSSEYVFLDSIAKQNLLSGVLVALNQVDKLVTADDIPGIQRTTELAMEKIFGKRIPVFPVSAINSLRAIIAGDADRLRQAGLCAIEEYLRNFLENERANSIVKTMAANLRIQCATILNTLTVIRSGLLWDTSQFETQAEVISEKIQVADKEILHIRDDFLQKFEQAKNSWIGDYRSWLIGSFRSDFMKSLNRAEVQDLRTEYITDAVDKIVGAELKRRWQVFSCEVNQLVGDILNRQKMALVKADSFCKVSAADVQIQDSIFESISADMIAAALAVLAYALFSIFHTVVLIFVGKMIGIIGKIKDFQKEMLLKQIDNALGKTLPDAADQVEKSFLNACLEVESTVLSELNELRKATLGSMEIALETIRAERLKGEADIESQRKSHSTYIDTVQQYDRQLEQMV